MEAGWWRDEGPRASFGSGSGVSQVRSRLARGGLPTVSSGMRLPQGALMALDMSMSALPESKLPLGVPCCRALPIRKR